MAYDRIWDETFPPDSQAANLLGQDLRNAKADVRQRVASFGAGPIASRPTPEALFVGVIYIATDTAQIFRWNGASWDDITSSLPSQVLYANHNSPGFSGDVIEHNVVPITTIKANSLGVNGAIRITFINQFVSGGISHLRFRFNGAIVWDDNHAAGSYVAPTTFIWGNTGVPNNQQFSYKVEVANQATGTFGEFFQFGGTAIDTTADITFNVTWQAPQAGDQSNFYNILVERLAHA